ncbi:hypothetical protein I4U23_016439 [Adineta vaga]|nr:hypothetical protein I4U23_016439 [Adineta vaga]
MGRQMTWRKSRKMAIQLLGISTSFLIFNVGYFVLAIGQMVYDSSFGASLMFWFAPINLCTLQMVFPFFCLGTIPHLKQKLQLLNPWRRRAVVHPTEYGRT